MNLTSLYFHRRNVVWMTILGLVLLAGCQTASVISTKDEKSLDPSRKAAMHLAELFESKLPATKPATTSSPATAEAKIVSEAVMAYFQAKAAISEKDYKGAIKELKKALEIDPAYLPAHTLLMTIAFEQDDTALAAQQARIVLGKDPNDATANYILGSTLLDAKEFDPAMDHLYRAMNNWNSKDGLPKLENLLAAFKLGGLLASQGYLTATIEVYGPLLEELERLDGQANVQDPRIERMVEIYRPGLYLLLGELSIKLKQYPQALSYYERARTIPTIESTAQLGAIKSHIAMGNKKQAGTLLDQTAKNDLREPVIELYQELYPKSWPEKVIGIYQPSEKNIDIGLHIVRELQKTKKFQASISLLKKIRTVPSAESQSIWYLVKAYDAIGQTNQAALTLLNSVATNPQIFAGIPTVIDNVDFELGNNLHKALSRMDVAADKRVARTFLLGLTAQVSYDYPAAEKYYRQIVGTGDRFLPAYVLWGHLLYMQRNWSAAAALMDQAISKDLKTGSIYFIKGRSYAELDDTVSALAALEQARKLNPESDQIMLALVEAYLQSNDSARAIALLKELIGNQVAGPRVLIRMTQILLDSNTNDLAESILQNYLQRFGPDDEYDLLNARLTFIKDQDVSAYREKLLALKSKLEPGVVDRDLAELEYNVGNFSQAGNIAEDALAGDDLIEPDNYQRLLQISALSHWKLLEYEIAENAWLRLIHDWPTLRVSKVALARMYMDWQNYAKGLPLIESLLATEKDEPQKKEYQALLVSCYIKQNKIIDGLNVIDQWLVSASGDDRVRYLQMKIDALVEEKMFDEALAVTQDLIGDKEKPLASWQQMQITIYLQMGKPEDALNAAQRYAIESPENKPFFDGLTIQPLLALKQYDKAIAVAESLVQAVSKEKKIAAVIVLIQCYQQAGRYDMAIEYARKQLPQYPESPLINLSLHQQIVRSLELAGRFNEAEKYILAQHDKSEGETKNQWQQILTADYFASGRNDRAIKLLETILAVNPNLGWANNSLGYALANHGKDYPRAEALIRKAVATEPGLGAYLDSLGWVLYRQRKYEQAYQYTLMAYRGMTEPDPVVLDHLGDICFALKKYDQARRYWQESVQISKNHDLTTLEPGMPERTIKKLKRLK